MRCRQKTGSLLWFGAVSLLVIGTSPVVVVAGELLNRHYLKGLRARPDPALPRLRLTRRSRAARGRRYARYAGSGYVDPFLATSNHRLGWLMAAFLANPVWIALTAPARWLIALTRRRSRHGGGGRRPPYAGVREPRRPKPTLPAGAIALPEPRWPES
jgi:hypothetical protein